MQWSWSKNTKTTFLVEYDLGHRAANGQPQPRRSRESGRTVSWQVGLAGLEHMGPAGQAMQVPRLARRRVVTVSRLYAGQIHFAAVSGAGGTPAQRGVHATARER